MTTDLTVRQKCAILLTLVRTYVLTLVRIAPLYVLRLTLGLLLLPLALVVLVVRLIARLGRYCRILLDDRGTET